jgi:TonB-linked SusC/RagA family outer membrane protein
MKKLLTSAPLPSGLLFFLLFSSFILSSAFAISQTVSGIVTDAANKPLAAVTVSVKGRNTATSTDNAGRFSIAASGTDVLVFTSVGYTSQEVAINNRSSITVSLAIESQGLGEVVVTALGISKESRRIGYAATNVKAEELTINRTTNPMNALQGKIAGVNISSLGTGPGGTSKIRIRGQSSLSGTNGPLIVINGIPFNNTNFGANPNNAASDNSIGPRGGVFGVTSDGGDGLQSINPDDIESMTVLKGAPAAALYGSRAKDGVIMITTKTKGKAKGLGVIYNLNYVNEQPLDFTDYQYVYGQGENGVRPTAPNPTSGQWSFGEKFQPGMTQILFDGVSVPYVPQYDRIKKFFRNGQNLTNTITLEAGGDKGGMHLSLSDMRSRGIVPNNTFNKKTINLGFSYNLSEKFSFMGNVNYSNEVNYNPPNVGNQDNTIPVALYNMSNSMPLDLLNQKKYNAAGNEFIYSRFMNRTNPYWVLAEQFHNIRRDRIFGNVSAKYNILPWLFVQGRIGQDFFSRDEDVNNFPTGHASRAAAPAGFVNGVYTQEQRRFRETNADVLVSATRDFGKFGVNLNGGGNIMRRRSDLNSVQVTDFVVRGLYTVQNGRAKDPLYALVTEGINSIYGSAELSYDRTFYLTATLRRDIFSTLAKSNRAVNYPSVSAGYIFSEHLKPSWLNYGKLRAGYAEVGSDNDVGAFADQLFYSINSNLINNPNGTPVPIGGPNSNTLPNAFLRPMRVAETEIGIELKMFDSRVNIDVAAYRKITTDQIVQAQVSDASGFVDTRINSGRSRNMGIEALLNIVPVETKNFTWEFSANTSYNITKVLSIASAIPGSSITVGTHIFNGELRQVVGKEMGQIAGFGYNRNDKGQQIFLANGLPQRTPNLVLFGSALPRWVGGFTNTINYRGVSFSFLIDYKLGNKMLSGTNFNAIRHGLHKMTLEGREGGVVGKGVNLSGQTNTTVAPVQQYWEHVRSQALVEAVIYNGGYWRLRQASIGYDFTRFIPNKWSIQGVRLNIVANNVLLIKKWVDNIDPESFGYTSDNLVGLESTGLPTTRSIGFNLNVRF